MDTAKTKPISVNEQVIAVTQQFAKLRNSLDSKQTPEVVEGLKSLENSLERISEILIPLTTI